MAWVISDRQPDNGKFRFLNPETGEIRETSGGFDGFVRDKDMAWEMLGDIAESLGPDVLRRWEDGDESLNLAVEVRRLRRAVRQLVNPGAAS